MNEKSPRPGGTDTTGTGTGGASYQHSHYTASAQKMQERVLMFLHYGIENAVGLRDLTAAANLDGRTVRAAIHAARLRGYPIISDNASGYWLSENPDEVRHFVNSMRHRARMVAAVADAVEMGGGLYG